tara:strand:+ start:11147 stop:11506 length:360 start_codon:yes stop_codon:yes gene_type:complete
MGAAVFSQNTEEKKQLTISGTLLSQKDLVSDEKILLYEGDNAISSTVSNDLGFFEFELEYDKLYNIVIGSENYKMKWLTIGTKIPKADRANNHIANIIVNIDPRQENVKYTIIKKLAQK